MAVQNLAGTSTDRTPITVRAGDTRSSLDASTMSLLDVPPLLESSDSAMLLAPSDVVLLIVDVDAGTRTDVDTALEELRQGPREIALLVLSADALHDWRPAFRSSSSKRFRHRAA
jgi:class 3 adenylate cyclase